MDRPVLEIEGTQYEGGGGLIRETLAYASILNKPVCVQNIRANRPGRGGLRGEHTIAIDTIARLCGAEVTGNTEANRTVTFIPHAHAPDLPPDGIIECTFPGAAAIFAIAMLPYALFAELSNRSVREQEHMLPMGGVTFRIRAGTLCIKAPSFGYMQQVIIPWLRRIGLSEQHLILESKHMQGFHTDFAKIPGLVTVRVKPLLRAIPAFQLTGRGRVMSVRATAHAPAMQMAAIRERLEEDLSTYFGEDMATDVDVIATTQPGQYHLLITATTEEPWAILGFEQVFPAREGFPDGIENHTSKLLKHLSRLCIRGLQDELKHGKAVDEHMENILVPYQVLADGFSTVNGRDSYVKEYAEQERAQFVYPSDDYKYDDSTMHQATSLTIAHQVTGIQFSHQAQGFGCYGLGMEASQGHNPVSDWTDMGADTRLLQKQDLKGDQTTLDYDCKNWAPYRAEHPQQYTIPTWKGFKMVVTVLVGVYFVVLMIVYAPYDKESISHDRASQPLDCNSYQEDYETVSPYILDSIFSLLKQWPNSYAPNGHSIVPGILRPNTLLYHASHDQKRPSGPTYFALDYDMSMGIYGGTKVTYLHTMSSTRPLSILYVDGTSAALTTSGSLDSQYAILNGLVPRNPSYSQIYDDNVRAQQWCEYLSSLDIDGVLRMNAGFEVMLCDYEEAGVQHLLTTNVSVPGSEGDRNDPALPRDPNRSPPDGFGNVFAPWYGFEWVRSATWRYGNRAGRGSASREQRVTLDTCGLVTFYNPSLRSLIGEHQSGIQDGSSYQSGWGLRRGHRLLATSRNDAAKVGRMIAEAIDAIRNKRTACSGVDWQSTTELLTDQHKPRILTLQGGLARAINRSWSLEHAMLTARALSHQAIGPYWQYPKSGDSRSQEEHDLVLRQCERAYTGHIAEASLSNSEVVIKQAIEQVMRRVCSLELDVFMTADQWSKSGDATEVSMFRLQAMYDKTQRLIRYLGWDNWSECPEQCSDDVRRPDFLHFSQLLTTLTRHQELCYIPMWPVVYAPGMRQGAIWGGENLTEDQAKHFWQPKCLSKEDWDCGGTRSREPDRQIPNVGRDDCKYAWSPARRESGRD